MDKLISAEKLIKAIKEKAKRIDNLDTINGLCGTVSLIYEQKPVDAIPIIKCNICKYYTKMEGCLNDRCERFKDTTHPYCYCYWGKEKGAD